MDHQECPKTPDIVESEDGYSSSFAEPLSPNQTFNDNDANDGSPRIIPVPSPEAELEALWNISPSQLHPLSPGTYSNIEEILNPPYPNAPAEEAQAKKSNDDDEDPDWKDISPLFSPYPKFIDMDSDSDDSTSSSSCDISMASLEDTDENDEIEAKRKKMDIKEEDTNDDMAMEEEDISSSTE